MWAFSDGLLIPLWRDPFALFRQLRFNLFQGVFDPIDRMWIVLRGPGHPRSSLVLSKFRELCQGPIRHGKDPPSLASGPYGSNQTRSPLRHGYEGKQTFSLRRGAEPSRALSSSSLHWCFLVSSEASLPVLFVPLERAPPLLFLSPTPILFLAQIFLFRHKQVWVLVLSSPPLE